MALIEEDSQELDPSCVAFLESLCDASKQWYEDGMNEVLLCSNPKQAEWYDDGMNEELLCDAAKQVEWYEDGMNEELSRVAEVVANQKRVTWEEPVVDNERRRKKAVPKQVFDDMGGVQWGIMKESKAEVDKFGRLTRVMKAREEWKAQYSQDSTPTVDLDEDVCQMGGALRQVATTPPPQPSTSQEPVGNPEPTIPVSHDCPYCEKSFTHFSNFSAHIKKKHSEWNCPRCNKKFDTKFAYDMHRRTCQKYGLPYGKIESEFFDVEIVKQFDAAHVQFILSPKELSDALEFVFGEASQVMKPIFYNFLDNFKPFKMNVTLYCTLHKLNEPEIIMQANFSKAKGELTPSFQTYDDVEIIMERQCDDLTGWVERFNQMASNWVLQSIDKLVYDCSEINFVKGGTGKCILPPLIQHSKAVINFELVEFGAMFYLRNCHGNSS